MPETDHDEDGKSDVNYGEKCHENYEKSDGKTLPELKKMIASPSPLCGHNAIRTRQAINIWIQSKWADEWWYIFNVIVTMIEGKSITYQLSFFAMIRERQQNIQTKHEWLETTLWWYCWWLVMDIDEKYVDFDSNDDFGASYKYWHKTMDIVDPCLHSFSNLRSFLSCQYDLWMCNVLCLKTSLFHSILHLSYETF